MRKILIVGALAMAGMLQAQPSQAGATGRWCANVSVDGNAVNERCDFLSFGACRRFINAQPQSMCIRNSRYRGYWTGVDVPEHSAFQYY